MRILLTGGAGFIGSHLVEHVLTQTSHDLVVLDSLSYAGDMSRFTDRGIVDFNARAQPVDFNEKTDTVRLLKD